MCEYCGCRQVEPITELMDEHDSLVEIAADLRRALVAEDAARVIAKREELVELLGRHTGVEEAGIFAALKQQGDFAEEIETLEGEHVSLDKAVASLDIVAPGALAALDALIEELTDHIDKENNGIFPVAVVTLGASGWDVVDQAREHAHDHEPHPHPHPHPQERVARAVAANV